MKLKVRHKLLSDSPYCESNQDLFEKENTLDYNGKEVIFLVESMDDSGKSVTFTVKTKEGRVLVRKTFDLSEYQFARIHAWRDYGYFTLESKIKVVHK